MYRVPVVSVQIPVGIGTPAVVACPPSPEKEVRLDPDEGKKSPPLRK
jgi:hypothetical protein